MKNPLLTARLRDWHLWLGILLTIPILIIGVTTVYLIHKKSFEGPMTLPEKGGMTSMQRKEEARSVLPVSNGTRLVASEQQLYLQQPDGSLSLVEGVSEVRDLVRSGEHSVVMASKTGLWRWTSGQSPVMVKEGEWHSLSSADGRMFATSKQSIVTSTDGNRWTVVTDELTEPGPKVFLSTADGRQWFGGKDGLVVRKGEEPPRSVVTDEISDLEQVDDALIAAGKTGLWRVSLSDGTATALKPIPVRSLTLSDDTVTASGKQGVWNALRQKPDQWSTVDLGSSFSNPADTGSKGEAKNKQDKKEPSEKRGTGFRLDKLMKDLHTGKFLGQLQWVWGDLLGLSMVFFGISGLIMWWRSRGVLLQQAETAAK